MPRDGEIAAIFNPRRVRAPSVVVTGDSPNGPFSGFTNVVNTTTPQLIHSDSIASGPDAVESIVCIQNNNAPTPTADTAPTLPNATHRRSSNKCKDSCCSELAQKVYAIQVMDSRFLKLHDKIFLDRSLDVFRCMRYHTRNSFLGGCNTLHQILIFSTK